ncbi:hypothetical protein [Oceanobacillus halophilus]|uniref:DUF4352 domain-containing protein n=1 Tax=Oceanobacillus halophilus TaxID=930130 RepID=A0A494ZW26_9BACI|nr:hypothetical protein [Oceanobacillus halophilus]RKQ30771.1 hypothetical protein D8M06_15245 [Oceanobacillus halophilus]
MKNALLMIITTLVLSGCINPDQQSEPVNDEFHQKKETDRVHAESTEKNDPYMHNPQAPDTRSLENIGQEFTDENGKVILKAISDYMDTHRIGPVELSITDIKVMDYTPALHLIDYFHGFTNNETNFHYIKLAVTINNTSSEDVNFAPVSILKTNKGEMKNFEDDFYLQNLHGILLANEQKSGELAFILDETTPDKLTEIQITTSDIFDENNESIQKGKEINIHF